MENSTIEKRVVGRTDVYIGIEIIPHIVPRLRSVFEEGALVVVYENECESVANALMQELKKDGYRVFATSVFDDKNVEIPDYVRYVFCVGGKEAQEHAKRLCKQIDTGWSMLLCAPDCDDVLCDICPNQVFIDENILMKCQNERIAAGYGILFSQKLDEFERFFEKTVLGKNVKTFCTQTSCESLCDLAFRLLEISSRKERKNSQEIMAEVMRALAISKGKKPRLSGEYEFLASATLASFYSSFLSSPSIDCAPPACLGDVVDRLKELGIEADRDKCVDFFDINGYFRISYILGEYRLDLLEKLAGIDLHGMQRFWRRLYLDAGYWLKSEISAAEVLECMRLAGAMSDGLIGFAFASGILDRIAA